MFLGTLWSESDAASWFLSGSGGIFNAVCMILILMLRKCLGTQSHYNIIVNKAVLTNPLRGFEGLQERLQD